MEMIVEDSSAKKWTENFREQKIGDGLEPIPGCGMTGNLYAQAAQLLNQAPHF